MTRPDRTPAVRVMWESGRWKCVLTGTTLELYFGLECVASKEIRAGRAIEEAESCRLALEAVLDLEAKTWRKASS